MKLRFMNGRCLNAPSELVRDPYPEMLLWHEAFERREYVRLTLRVTSELPGSVEIFPRILRALSELLQDGLLMVHSLDTDRVVSALTKPFEYTADSWIVRVIPLAPDLREVLPWDELRHELLSIESELHHRQYAELI